MKEERGNGEEETISVNRFREREYQGTCRELQVFSDNGGQDMRFKIVHEIKGRIRIHMDLKRISPKDADILQYYLLEQPCILAVKVYERNQDAAICYTGKKEEVISIL